MRVPAVLVLLSSFALAIRPAGADIPGSGDHPLVSRYAGSEIIRYDRKEFDAYALFVRRATTYGGKEKNLAATEPIEGRVTRITYQAPEGRTTLEVMRNYEAALREAGFETRFACANEECGGRNFNHAAVPYSMEFAENFRDQRYLAARLRRAEGDAWVSLYIVRNTTSGGRLRERVFAQLDVIETTPMESGMVTVDAEAMGSGLDADGRVALYNIFFDTDRAEVKPESRPALEEIAKLLRSRPGLSLLVVGHTDNVGALEYNQQLSLRRASAVVQALTADHGIAAARLTAGGAGMLAPVASNRTDEGRARNRRVELVER